MKNAILIGAGPAGLTAAYHLLKETDIHPILFEKSSMIGGISQTATYKENRIDLGGHRFFTKNREVMNLWQELMPLQGAPSKDDLLLNRKREFPGNVDPEIAEDVFLVRNRVSRIFYLAKFFDYPISMKFQTFANMGLWRTIKAGFGYLYSAIFKRKENNLEDFYINRFGKPLYSMFFEDYTEKLWGKHPKYISAEWGSQRVKGLSLSKAILSAITKPFKKKSVKVETSLIEEFYYPKKGPGQLYEKMAAKIIEMGGEIYMNADVTSIHLENGNITAVEVTQNKEIKTYSADFYLSSMAIKDFFERTEDAPKLVKEVATNLPYRDFITVGLLLKDIKLKNKTKIKTYNDVLPDCWIYIQERNVKVGRIQIFNNWSPYMVNDFENHVWIGLEYFCSEGDSLWTMPDKEFIDFAISEMVKIGVIDKQDVVDAFRLKMEKAYPAYFDAYEKFPMVREYLQNINNLYCIGRNGQHRYNNMDHSMLTAFEAVESMLDPNRDRNLLWEVNAEKEYHEEVKK
ncbi:MAG: NAD(P)/FAD-dependent oxidoreductase [Candidatus Izemoplasmatales bacterium]|nr:NAD(P)/FAD-dependent oxidoreductase [Candidatus Izemoplasmatales bacterium]MDY0138167.1 NAD(P)/FAD-dependent oxidoreductase [Candidatus Izemoplasmatales bacterium]